MKKNEYLNLKSKSLKELEKEVENRQKEAMLSYAQIKAGRTKNTAAARKIRREIAQIQTLIRQKQIIDIEAKNKEKKL